MFKERTFLHTLANKPGLRAHPAQDISISTSFYLEVRHNQSRSLQKDRLKAQYHSAKFSSILTPALGYHRSCVYQHSTTTASQQSHPKDHEYSVIITNQYLAYMFKDLNSSGQMQCPVSYCPSSPCRKRHLCRRFHQTSPCLATQAQH